MTRTSDLVERLVADATPVRRLRAPVPRAACWLLFATLVMLCVGIAHGVRADLALKVHQSTFVFSVAAAMATGVLAAVGAFIASIPGMPRRWLLLPAPAALVWVATIGYGCLTNWVVIGPEGVALGETARCFATLALVGMPLSFLMLTMLRHVARLSPAPVTMVGSLAVAAVTAAALSILHPLEATAMILLWNFGVTALFLALGGRYGKQLLQWLSPRSGAGW
ncbi:NrsF family protein [Cupriavidus sp. TMH.W2]|uniref:NrsF family protein n=1 Tax=Cupriavidus sp. TMH.W2 TaxID=3434465 RepID=UPI003D76BB77